MVTRHRNNGLSKICECPRRRWAKCSHSWHFNFKPKGGPSYRFSVDTEVGKHIESKTDAEGLADSWRTAIRAGTFRRRVEMVLVVTVPATDTVTVAQFIDRYFERRGKPATKNELSCRKRFEAFQPDGARAYGETALTAMTEDAIELFVADLRAKGRVASTRNQYIQFVKAMFRWATKKGYLTRNPTADSDALKREKHAQRDRRLEPDEEDKILEQAGPHLQRVIIAALETCCRRGELLSLTWGDVHLKRRELVIRSEKTKTRVGRVLPISARLLGILELAKTDPTGKRFGPEDFVFGDVVGRQVSEVKKAWVTAVLKAHGHTPKWVGKNTLAPKSRAAYHAINLTFHDLRHEAGSRLLEAGWPLHSVSHMLGHANIAQTSTYLNATKVGLQEAMRRLDDSRYNPVPIQTGTDRPLRRNGNEDKRQQPTVN